MMLIMCPECNEVMEVFGEGPDQVAACIRCPITITLDSKEWTNENEEAQEE